MAVAASRFVCSPEQSWPASDAPEQGDASAAQAGDKAERWALLSLHRDRVVALMRARGVSVEDAEDSVHDAIVQLMAHPALDHRAGSLLTVVAMRRAYDRQRVRMREHRALGRIGRLAEMHVSPADAALDRVEAEWLAGHVGQLPQRQREVVGHHASGLTAVETARSLGITTKAAECALSRARVTLRAVAAGVSFAVLWLLRRAHAASTSAPAAAATVAVGLLATTAPTAVHPGAALLDDEQHSAGVVTIAHAIRPTTTAEDRGHTIAHVAADAASGAVSRQVRPAVPPVSPAAPPPPSSVLTVHAGDQGAPANGNAHVQRYDGNSSFTQSVQKCVAQGVSLDPQHLGCSPG